MKKRVFCLLLSAALIMSLLAGCGTKTDKNGSGEDTRPVFRFAGNAGQSMDPANAYNGWPTIRNGVAETLFKMDADLNAVPFLVEEYKLSDDHMTWTLTLKDGITFQNGKAMDGEAVKKSLEHTLELNDRAPGDLMVDHIDADGMTVSITTTQPNPVLINSLTDPYACIIDVESGTDFENYPIGTGPYMVQENVQGESTTLVPYDGYWGGTPKLSRIEVVKFSDKDAMTNAMLSGEIDAAYAMSYEGQMMLKDNPDYKLLTVATTRVYKLYYNYHNEDLANPNVRKAISMLADKASYGSVVMSGNGEPATGCFPDNSIYGSDLTATGFDVDGAVELLRQEGYADTDGDGFIDKDGRKLSFRIVSYSSRAELPLISDALASQLKEVGIDSTINITDSATDTLKQDQFDIAPYAFVTMPTGEPAAYLHTVFASAGTNNFGHFENAEVDKLIAELDTEFDVARRSELTRQIVQLALDEDAYCFMDYLKMSIVTKASVTGIVPHPSDYYQITVDTAIG